MKKRIVKFTMGRIVDLQCFYSDFTMRKLLPAEMSSRSSSGTSHGGACTPQSVISVYFRLLSFRVRR